MAADTSARPRFWRVTRAVSAIVTLLAVAALGTFAVTGANTIDRKTTVTKRTTVVKQATPAAHPSTSASALQSPPLPLLVSVSPTSALEPVAAAKAPTIAARTPVTDPATSSPAPAPTTGDASALPSPSDLPACPLPLKAPANPGGLQSLVGLAPFFGPFSSEAFAAAPLFQPFLQAIGPFLVVLADDYAKASPALAPLVAQLESFENEGFAVISPLYGSHRSQFLAAESALATALAPLAKDVAGNSTVSCLVDVEAVLTGATPTA
jgi:hypothetical protein